MGLPSSAAAPLPGALVDALRNAPRGGSFLILEDKTVRLDLNQGAPEVRWLPRLLQLARSQGVDGLIIRNANIIIGRLPNAMIVSDVYGRIEYANAAHAIRVRAQGNNAGTPLVITLTIDASSIAGRWPDVAQADGNGERFKLPTMFSLALGENTLTTSGHLMANPPRGDAEKGAPVFVADLEMRSPRPADWLAWTQRKRRNDSTLAEGAAAEDQPLTLAGTLRIANGVADLRDAELRHGQSEASGFIAIEFIEGRPVLAATLDYERLHIDPSPALTPQPATAQQATGQTPPANSGTNAATTSPDRRPDDRRQRLLAGWTTFATADLERWRRKLRGLDFNVRLSSEETQIGTLSAGASALAIAARAGQFQADLIELDLQPGTANGRVFLSVEEPEAALRMEFEATRADLRPLSASLLNVPLIQGIGTLKARFASRFQDGASLMEELDGSVTVAVKDGGQLALDIVRLVEMAKADNLLGWPIEATNNTPFDALNANVILRDGRAFADRVRIASGNGTLVADGAVNLPDRQLYLRLDVSALSDGVADLRSLPRPATLMLRGPWAEPAIHLERLEPVATDRRSDGSSQAGQAPIAVPQATPKSQSATADPSSQKASPAQ